MISLVVGQNGHAGSKLLELHVLVRILAWSCPSLPSPQVVRHCSVGLAMPTCEAGSALARDLPEDCAASKSGSSRIVEIEQSSNHLACGEQSRDSFKVRIENLRLLGNSQAAVGKGYCARYRVGFKWGGVDSVRPI